MEISRDPMGRGAQRPCQPLRAVGTRLLRSTITPIASTQQGARRTARRWRKRLRAVGARRQRGRGIDLGALDDPAVGVKRPQMARLVEEPDPFPFVQEGP